MEVCSEEAEGVDLDLAAANGTCQEGLEPDVIRSRREDQPLADAAVVDVVPASRMSMPGSLC